ARELSFFFGNRFKQLRRELTFFERADENIELSFQKRILQSGISVPGQELLIRLGIAKEKAELDIQVGFELCGVGRAGRLEDPGRPVELRAFFLRFGLELLEKEYKRMLIHVIYQISEITCSLALS